MKFYSLYFMFLCISLLAHAQELNLSIDQDEIQIGEPLRATFSIVSEEKMDSIFYKPQRGIFLGRNSSDQEGNVGQNYELEILNEFRDTVYKEGKKYIWKGTYTLTAWDSAFVVIPPEPVYVEDSLYYFPPALIRVTSPSAGPSKDIYDINEEFTEIPEDTFTWKNFFFNYGWWILLILIFTGSIIFYTLKKRKKGKVILPLSLREETLKKIDALEESKGYEHDLKEFYFDLSLLLRDFLARHYGMRMLDKTTSEIEDILAFKGLEKHTVKLTTKVLTQSDMVKFARSNPPREEVFAVTNEARRIVNEVADLDLNINDE
ncbi:MAG: hypothetical protein R3277_01415 [Brumimicrobium sp.]|nr:hypothetical protein [Brumimicrobium sp.]